MKKVVIFDMDDTLYDEWQFVKSGFKAVSNYLADNYQLDENEVFECIWQDVLSNGRGKVFDDILKRYDIYSKKLVKKCVSIYRLHEPDITLDDGVKQILIHLKKDYELYLITDGNKNAQYNKVKALKLEHYMKKCYITHRYGKKHSKPSPYCFQLICNKEKVDPAQVVYIGDNPRKDFIGIKSLGFKTIRIMTGQHKEIKMPEEYEAKININSLQELPHILGNIWSK